LYSILMGVFIKQYFHFDSSSSNYLLAAQTRIVFLTTKII